MAVTPTAPIGGACSSLGVDISSTEETIRQHLQDVDHHLQEAEKKELSPSDRRTHLYKAIELYTAAVHSYEELSNPSSSLKDIDWEDYRQRILSIGTNTPGISKKELLDAQTIEARCYVLKDNTKKTKMICTDQGKEVACKPGQKKIEKLNEKLFFCYPQNWRPNKILTGGAPTK